MRLLQCLYFLKVIRQQAEKINEMASVMHRAAFIDDENAPKEEELLSQLVIENKVNILLFVHYFLTNHLKNKHHCELIF